MNEDVLQRFDEIDAVFEKALDHAPAARSAYLDEACGGDARLRDAVERLLRSSEADDDPLVPAGGLQDLGREDLEDPESAPGPGKTVGPYRIDSLLGEGGMGRVFRAHDTRLQREVALKVLDHRLQGRAQIERFGREARAASALNHPNIVTIYDVGNEADVYYIAMEYVDGETLRDRMAGGRIDLDEALALAEQVATGLAAAHASGIVHRDLKPGNIMVTAEGVPKIVDFGLAKMEQPGAGEASTTTQTEPLTAEGTIFGTLGYMSPEQARGESLDYRSDLFSLGAVLYEMLTGRRAFQRDTGVEVLAAILKETPPPISGVDPTIPPPLQWAVERCLQKDPADRYESTRDLARDLRAVRRHRAGALSDRVSCASCEATNSREHRFCSQCGAPLHRPCPACGKEQPVDAAFCGSCGTGAPASGEKSGEGTAVSNPSAPAPALARDDGSGASVLSGERRQATVMVTRIVDYDALIDRALPEELDRVLANFESASVEVVERFGGVIDRVAQDEVVALFGVPAAHEDDALRAVRAALQLQDQLRSCGGMSAEARLSSAVHTGFVVVQGTATGARSVVGETASIARNLAQVGGAGYVLLTPETRRLAGNSIRTQPLDAIRLRRGGEKVVPQRVVSTKDSSVPPLEASEAQLTEFAGRQGELGTLLGYVEAAAGGEGQFVTVVGEAGAGKSRLFLELRRQLDRDATVVVEGRCESHGERVPYLPMIHACRAILGVLEEDPPEVQFETAVDRVRAIDSDLESLLPLYLQLLAIPSERYRLPSHIEGKPFRHAMQEALAALFTLASRAKPVVLILEDWHWVDEASHDALRQLVEMCPGYALLVAVGYRPEAEPDWGSPAHLRTIHLGALGPVSSGTILGSVLGAKKIPRALISLVHERTGGNPFFLEEVGRTLLETGALRVKDGAVTVADSMEGLQIPDTVQSVIRSRLDRIEPGPCDLLRRASVVGREFSLGVLRRVVEDTAGLDELLATLKTRGLVRQARVVPEPVFSFQHALTQEVAYDSLLQRQRMELHGRVGQALEQELGERREEHYDTLARHFAEAEHWERAVRYGLLSAQRARGLSQFADALHDLEHTQAWLEHLPESRDAREQRISLLQEEAQVCEVVGDRQRQQRAIDDLLQLLRDDEGRPELVQAYLGRAELLAVDRDFEGAGRTIDEALQLSRRLGNSDLERDAMRSKAFVLWQSGRNEEALEALDRTVEMDQAHTDTHRIVGNLSNRASVLRAMGRYDEAIASLKQALALCEQPGSNPHRHVEALYVLYTIYRDLGRGEEGERYLRKAITVQSEDRFTVHQPFHTSALANLLIERGEIDEALGLLRDSVERSRQSRYAFGLSRCQQNLAQALLGLGRDDEALPHLLEAGETFRRLRENAAETQVLAEAGPILERTRRLEEAKHCWERVVEATERPELRVLGYQGLARVAELRGDEGRARAHLRRALSICPHPTSERRGEMLNALGILEWKRGRFDAALECYRQALEIFEKKQHGAHTGLVLNSIAVTLKSMGRDDEAGRTLERALRVHERSGQDLYRGHALALLGDLAFDRGEYGTAHRHYEDSLALRLRLADRRGEGWMRHHLARTLRALQRTEQSLEQAALAAAIAEETDDLELAEACSSLGSG